MIFMKVWKRVLAVMLCTAVLAGAEMTGVLDYTGISGEISVNAATYGSFEYTVSGNAVTIDKCNSTGIKITVPSEIDGKPVTRIASEAFNTCENVKMLTLPDSIEDIGNMAFAGCENIASLTLPSSLKKIGTYAFGYCIKIKEVTIPAGVTSIGYGAFCECYSLEKILVASGNANYISRDGVLFTKDMNRLMQFPAGKSGKYTVPSSVSYISEYAFQGCQKITEAEIPFGVANIGMYAFCDCPELKKVYIPATVNYIGSDAFCFTEDVTIYGTKDTEAYLYAKRNKLKFVENALANNSTISANTIVLGGTVTLNAKATGGAGSYTYAVLYKKNSDKNWTVKQNYSTNSRIVVKPAKATDYSVCVKVKDGSGTIVKKFFDVKVNAKLANNSTISANSIKYGSTFTVNAKATGGMGSYTYAVLYKKQSETKWTVKQNYSTNAKVAVKPYKATGYNVCVKVKDSTGTIAKKYFEVNVTN